MTRLAWLFPAVAVYLAPYVLAEPLGKSVGRVPHAASTIAATVHEHGSARPDTSYPSTNARGSVAAVRNRANNSGVRPSGLEETDVPTVSVRHLTAQAHRGKVDTAGLLLGSIVGAETVREPASTALDRQAAFVSAAAPERRPNNAAGRVIPALLSPADSGPATTHVAVQRDEPARDVSTLRPALMPARSARGSSVDSPSLSVRAEGPRAFSLLAARVCHVEAELSVSDCVAITYVLQARARRSGWTFARMALAYSALMRGGDRARFARELPDGDLEEWSKATNRKWAAVRRAAALALEGRIANPCKSAVHWGGPQLAPDSRRAAKAVGEGRWRRVRCTEPVQNAFYAEVRGATLSAAEAAPQGAVP